jgi:DNA polymerase III subunit beta
MKIIISSSVLLQALELVKKAIERNTSVPIIENFLFDVRNNVLTVSATDLYTTIKTSWRIECNAQTAFRAVVPKEIITYLKKLDGPITLTYNAESYSIELLEEDARAKYSGENPEDFPVIPQTNIQIFETTSDMFHEFKDLLNYTHQDDLRPAMSGIGFVQHVGAFNMIATDGHKLKVVNMPELNTDTNMSVESHNEYCAHMQTKIDKYKAMRLPFAYKQAKVLQSLLDETEKQAVKQYFILRIKAAKILSDLKFGTAKKPERAEVIVCSNAVVGTESKYISFLFTQSVFDIEVITRDIDERYPQYWNVIPQKSTTQYLADKKRMLSVIDKAVLFANKTTHQVRLSLNGKNKISAEDLDFSNEYCAEVGGSYIGEPIEIGFNGELLRDTINSFGDEFTLEMSAPNKVAVIREGNSLALVMPVMLNEYA